ncbi:hypothetical protein SMC26_13490 [Actinomadura fulvescens]|uniref:Uncharacterized protein n=1 Tax=Actinomadura fulvescens TaxID=46160 RepID=A0ABP6BXD3_9ACTN
MTSPKSVNKRRYRGMDGDELMTDHVLGHLDATLDEIIEITLVLVDLHQSMRELAEGRHT